MSYYPPKINARFCSPFASGRVSRANGVGTSASFECGSFVRIFLEIDNGRKIISRAAFETNGCGYMAAAADVVAEMLSGKELAGLHGLTKEEFDAFLVAKLEEFPPARRQCSDLVFSATKDAFADHRSYLIEEFSGEKALICTCFGISEETIEAYIVANAPASVADVTAACRAGSGCGSCQMLIQEMLDSVPGRYDDESDREGL